MADPDDDTDRPPADDENAPGDEEPGGDDRPGDRPGEDGEEQAPGESDSPGSAGDPETGRSPGDDPGDGDDPGGEPVDVNLGESFGGGADPGEDPHDAGPDAGPEGYAPDHEDRRAGRERDWTDEDDVRSELDRLWEELEGLEDHVEGRTVSREAFEADMRRYVRWKLRKGHVTGWGPYVVLLYGTGMTLGAFYYLESIWAILAMVVVWLSTLGLYVVMVALGIGIGGVRFAWKYLDKVRSMRSEP